MDLNTITSLIGSLGFPIFVAVWMLWKSDKETQEHHEEVAKLSEAINDLKVVVTVLSEKFN